MIDVGQPENRLVMESIIPRIRLTAATPLEELTVSETSARNRK